MLYWHPKGVPDNCQCTLCLKYGRNQSFRELVDSLELDENNVIKFKDRRLVTYQNSPSIRIPLNLLFRDTGPCQFESENVRDYCTSCNKEIAQLKHIRYCQFPNTERFCTRAKYPVKQSAFEIPIVDCYSCKDYRPKTVTKPIAIVTALLLDFNELGKLTIPFMQQYATKCGADFIILSKRKFEKLHIHFEKFQIEPFFDWYERILWIDLDVLICPDTPNIFEIVPTNLFGVYDEREQKLSSPYYNMGVFLASKNHRNLFHPPDKSGVGSCPEQHYLQQRLVEMKYPIMNLDSSWNGRNSQCSESNHFVHFIGGSGSNKASRVNKEIDRLSLPIPRHENSMPLGRQMIWAYGLTTIPEREHTYFVHTLESLKQAGFDKPHLFIDGDSNYERWRQRYGLGVTCRYPNLKIYGNWLLAMWELYLRNPSADRYAIFQDDLVASKNLRQYLEQIEYPNRGYCNLYSFPENEILHSDRTKTGWYKSNQMGKGAVALVFNQEAVMALLAHWHTVKRVQDRIRGVEVVDGAITEVLTRQQPPTQGFTEYCHNPSLVQHTGDVSSHGSRTYPKSQTFKGEEFDALDLLKTKVVV